MNAFSSIPATVEIRRGRLFSLVGAVAVLAAAVTWAGFAATSQKVGPTAQAGAQTSYLGQASSSAPLHSVSIMTLTPEQLADGALGTGYALPSHHTGSTLKSVLASMSPQTRRYTQRIMRLTFAQLAAGAAGHA